MPSPASPPMAATHTGHAGAASGNGCGTCLEDSAARGHSTNASTVVHEGMATGIRKLRASTIVMATSAPSPAHTASNPGSEAAAPCARHHPSPTGYQNEPGLGRNSTA